MIRTLFDALGLAITGAISGIGLALLILRITGG